MVSGSADWPAGCQWPTEASPHLRCAPPPPRKAFWESNLCNCKENAPLSWAARECGGGGPLRPPPDVASALFPVRAAGQSTPQTSLPWVTPEVVTALPGNQLATRGHCHCPPGEDSEAPAAGVSPAASPLTEVAPAQGSPEKCPGENRPAWRLPAPLWGGGARGGRRGAQPLHVTPATCRRAVTNPGCHQKGDRLLHRDA